MTAVPVKFATYEELGASTILTSRPQAEISLYEPPIIGAIEMAARETIIPLPEDYVVSLKDAIVRPRQILLKDRAIAPDSLRRYDPAAPHDFLPYFRSNSVPSDLYSAADVLYQPAFYFDGEHMFHYGHFLLETLPRLWCWKGVDLSRMVFLSGNIDSEFVTKLAAPFGVRPDMMVKLDRPMLVRNLTVARQPYVLERTISQNARNVFRHISEWYDRQSPIEKIYVSRRKFGGNRHLTNEKEIEGIFSDHGFEIIHPQQMTIEDQVNVFGNAKVIAGPSGTAMYNLVFGRKKQRAIILASDQFVTRNDALINHGSDCEITYICGKSDPNLPGMKSPWTVDLDLLRSTLATI